MSKSFHRLIAACLLCVLGVLQAGIVFSAHSYHADDAVRVATYVGSHENDQGSANDATDAAGSTSAGDALLMADCAEHCGGAAILVTRRETPTLVSRGARTAPPAISLTAARPERLERPPKSVYRLA